MAPSGGLESDDCKEIKDDEEGGDAGIDAIHLEGTIHQESIADGAGEAPEEEEKEILRSWIRDKENDLTYRFGPSGSIDPSSQTEDLGDDAVKASEYGIANLKRIMPKLMKWTTKDGETYSELGYMYGQVLGQFGVGFG